MSRNQLDNRHHELDLDLDLDWQDHYFNDNDESLESETVTQKVSVL
jgi:hypothetical protein